MFLPQIATSPALLQRATLLFAAPPSVLSTTLHSKFVFISCKSNLKPTLKKQKICASCFLLPVCVLYCACIVLCVYCTVCILLCVLYCGCIVLCVFYCVYCIVRVLYCACIVNRSRQIELDGGLDVCQYTCLPNPSSLPRLPIGDWVPRR